MPKTNEVVSNVDFESIKIGLASPDMIREWSYGEVKKPETINYRSLKPEMDGLFCEKIFGPTKDWECHCGKYKKIRYKGVICDKCGVEVTKASVRRERMGHIELAAPVSHIWYFKGIPSRMGLILDISPRTLEQVLYFAAYIVLDPGDTDLAYKQVLTVTEYNDAVDQYGNSFRAGMGAESIQELLKAIDLDKEYEELSAEIENASGQKKARIIKRLEVVQAFRKSGNRPEWMILNVIPVIPPDLRPMVQLDGGRFATSDLNELYRKIINRNTRLRKLLDLGAPEIIVRNEKRMLQEAVDALIDNGRRGRPVTGASNRPLKSLSDMLKGKNGRFRQNLLGKRVDYSGRSVICVGPSLKIWQCGLPKPMALELFKPFVMKELVARDKAHNIKSAKRMVERVEPEVWDILEDVIKEHPVMLNRAPTLHRLGIQAFEPILVEGKAIRLHPLVCAAYNADFDGDQMAAHLPLTEEAKAECRFMLLSPNNLLKPSDGGIVAVPSQDMLLGMYYITQQRDGEPGEGKYFKSVNEAILAKENKVITLQSKVKIRMERTMPDGTVVSKVLDTSLGRCIFNEVIPQDLGYVDRSDPDKYCDLEIDCLVKKKVIQEILNKVIRKHGATKTAEVLDAVKALGYKYSTLAAMTVAVSDMTVPKEKQEFLDEAEHTVSVLSAKYRRGLMTDEERYKQVIETWKGVDGKMEGLVKKMDPYNNIYMMMDSGARGSSAQIKQLIGWRGLMAYTNGRTIELPIKSSFREGLDVLEYFISAHGSRKGLSDTALRTADSGYLTRRLVDVSQELIIRERDCVEGTGREIPGTWVSEFSEVDDKGNKSVIESLQQRITGRFSCNTICDKDGNVIVKANHMITPARAEKVCSIGVDEKGQPITKVKIRNILNCRSKDGICAKCYGMNMASGQAVQVGEAVGIIAAQSIGEPGTQLTMRTFHTGGVAGNDITMGLPRVEELFEARKPKGLAIVTEIPGKVDIQEDKKKRNIAITNPEDGETKTYLIPYGSQIRVKQDQMLEAGDALTVGSIDPHDLLDIKGVQAVQDYILCEVQKVYQMQKVDISDKHIEIIVHQMMRKARIEDAGDSNYMLGSSVDYLDVEDTNEELESEGKNPVQAERILLGITKASLATDSFLSAASFQETTRVLTEAAINGKEDHLVGLKENVIIGNLIPAGTGMKRYRDIHLNTNYTYADAPAAGFDVDDDEGDEVLGEKPVTADE